MSCNQFSLVDGSFRLNTWTSHFHREMCVPEEEVQHSVRSAVGSAGKAIMRKGENWIIKMPVSQDFRPK